MIHGLADELPESHEDHHLDEDENEGPTRLCLGVLDDTVCEPGSEDEWKDIANI